MKHLDNVDHPVNLKHLMVNKEYITFIVEYLLVNKEYPMCKVEHLKIKMKNDSSLLEKYIYIPNISPNFAFSHNNCALKSGKKKGCPACTCSICQKEYRYCKQLDSHQDEL